MRDQLARSLDWGEAHADFDQAVAGLAPELRGRRIKGLPHTAFGFVAAAAVVLAGVSLFRTADSSHSAAMGGATASPEPPSPEAWNQSVAAFRRDRDEVKRLATDASIDLASKIPHADKATHTYARAVLLVIDHNAYHVAELVVLRRLLGAWPPK